MRKNSKIRKVDAKNHESYHRHQRQKFWQIQFPLILGGLLVLALLVLMILSVFGVPLDINLRQTADVSLIWVLIPIMLIGFVFALILFALIFLLSRLVKSLPGLTSVVQRKASHAADKTGQVTYKLAQPVIKVKSFNARVKAFFNALKGPTKNRLDQ